MRSQDQSDEPDNLSIAAPPIVAIIACYNGGKYLDRSVASVLAQTVKPSEFIIVDDGSKDDSRQVIDRLAAEHPEITILSQANAGQSAANNLAVSRSTSPLIAFLDQDDAWYPEHLQLLRDALTSSSGRRVGWAYSDVDRVDADWNMVGHNFIRAMGAIHPKEHLAHCLGQDMNCIPTASLIRREAFEEVGGFDTNLFVYNDDDLFLRIFRSGYGNVFVPIALSAWRIHAASTSASPHSWRSRMIYLRKLLATFPDDPKSGVFWTRDSIVPRFRDVFLATYMIALRAKNDGLRQSSVEGLKLLAPHMRGKKGVIARAALPVMERPALAQLAFATGLPALAATMFR